MTYIVDDSCIKCKYGDCIPVCPVDCFYEGANMVVINPEECIDCGVCELECPVGAIKPDTEPNMEPWVEFNQKYANLWPRITHKPQVPENADTFAEVKNKLEDCFDPSPGLGDKVLDSY